MRMGIIAAGGQGTRFGERGLQKCLCPLDRKPLLSMKIDAFVKNDIDNRYTH
jgi:choline kinase